MKQYIQINNLLMACLLLLGAAACSDDKEPLPVVEPETTGTFVDGRDGHTYDWVRIGGLDWMCSNAAFDLNERPTAVSTFLIAIGKRAIPRM